MYNKAIEIAFFVGVVISLTSKLQTSFFTCEKTDTSNQKSQTVDRGASFAPNFPPFIEACSLQGLRFASASQAFNEKRFSQELFA